ncbi:MAG: aminotransferase class V-fold PLP-dependent enzyme [Spirulina sp. DLM2.Bin59]|nr:MAG: aminotransferase class V-fold PLP-dependent enzyme [Spirulina sp. DLM2.Bin59]
MNSADPAPLQRHRQQFPGLVNKAYFNFGGQGTMPKAAMEAIYRAYEYVQQQGPFSTKVNDWVVQEGAAMRAAFGQELGAHPDTITLTENVTAGCNIALWGIPWEAGDHILITDCEHPGVIAIIKEIARRFEVRVSTCPIMATLNRGNPAVVIEQHLQPQTRLVVVSHLLWNTGQILPLAEIIGICHSRERPIQVLVDAAQSVGSMPLDLAALGADFYAFTGHKWLCGPAGVGGLYVRPEALETLAPTFVGWRSINMDSTGMPTGWKPNGMRFEVATSAYPLYAGLRAAIATHSKWGTAEERALQIQKNAEYLWQGLSLLPKVQCLRSTPPDAGIVSFRLKADIPHKQLVQALEQQGFYLRTIISPDCVRACVHYLTLPAEMDQLIRVLASL